MIITNQNLRRLGNYLLIISLFAQACDVKGDDDPTPEEYKQPKYTNSYHTLQLKSLIAYWPFDGNGKDYSGNCNNATLNNTITTTDRFGNTNSAIYFNGLSSFATVADNPSLRLSNTDFSISTWIKADALNESFGSLVFSKRTSGSNNGWIWSMTGTATEPAGVMSFGPGGGSINSFGSRSVKLDQWTMVSCVYKQSSKKLSIYINGELDNVTEGILSPNAAINAALTIGKDAAGNSYYFKGSLDDLTIFNRALSDAELTQLYNSTALPISGLIAFWPLDNSGKDFSGNCFHASLNGIVPVKDRFGKDSAAIYFNGASSYGEVLDHSLLRLSNTDFTITLWAKIENIGSLLLSKRIAGADNGWQSSVTPPSFSPPGVLSFGPGGGSANAWGAKNISLDTWHMLTTVYQASNKTITLYLDGNLDKSMSGVLSPNSSITTNLFIGMDPPTGSHLKGAMDDIIIMNRALSSAEITKLYSLTSFPDKKNLE